MLTVSQLFIYPIKSLGGIEVPSSYVGERGFQYDRRWMLIDQQGRFITQREHKQLALFKTAIDTDHLIIYHQQDPSNKLFIPLQVATNESLDVTIWEDVCRATTINPAADAWFSERVGMNLRLVYMPDESRREVDPDYAFEKEITSFSDGYPILMIGQASLDHLNAQLEQTLPMDRFRPNIVFTGGEPHQEDEMKSFSINGVKMLGVKPCARCVMTTIDQATGTAGHEPLATLSTYRKRNNKILFGQNVIPKSFGMIKVGDSISA
jgi:uncharacterized protein YcbX